MQKKTHHRLFDWHKIFAFFAIVTCVHCQPILAQSITNKDQEQIFQGISPFLLLENELKNWTNRFKKNQKSDDSQMIGIFIPN